MHTITDDKIFIGEEEEEILLNDLEPDLDKFYEEQEDTNNELEYLYGDKEKVKHNFQKQQVREKNEEIVSFLFNIFYQC